jgi:hypothetical protein
VNVNDPGTQSVGWVSTTVYWVSGTVVVVVVVGGVVDGGNCHTAKVGSDFRQANVGSVVTKAVKALTW